MNGHHNGRGRPLFLCRSPEKERKLQSIGRSEQVDRQRYKFRIAQNSRLEKRSSEERHVANAGAVARREECMFIGLCFEFKNKREGWRWTLVSREALVRKVTLNLAYSYVHQVLSKR